MVDLLFAPKSNWNCTQNHRWDAGMYDIKLKAKMRGIFLLLIRNNMRGPFVGSLGILLVCGN